LLFEKEKRISIGLFFLLILKEFQKKNKKENPFIFSFISLKSYIVHFAWKGEKVAFLNLKDCSCFFFFETLFI
jgi:hypothetical protein